MKQLISIVIVHWNTPELLEKLLDLLKKSRDLQIIVVDNNSDRSLIWLKTNFPDVLLIKNKKNFGYAYACNQGAKKSKGDWLLFLNPDVEIAPQQIQTMKDFVEKNKLDAASPQPGSDAYRKPLPTVWSLLVEFTPLNRIISLNTFRAKTLFGGCLLIRSDIFKKINGWDEDFFLWFEDCDLTYRLIQKNYSIGWIPVKIKHIGGASFAQLNDKYKRQLFFNSMSTFAKKHFSPLGKLVVLGLKTRYIGFKKPFLLFL